MRLLINILRRKQAQIPRFPTDISAESFNRTHQLLRDIGYNGPVAISCDDTKLHAGLRPMWDPVQQAYVLLGGVGTPPLSSRTLMNCGASLTSTRIIRPQSFAYGVHMPLVFLT